METKNNKKSLVDNMKLSEQKMSLLIVFGCIIVIVLGIIIVQAAARITQDPSYSPTARYPTPTPEPRSEMWLDPAQVLVPVNRPFVVQVMLDAQNEVIHGTDAILEYDPTYVTVLSIEEPNEPNSVFTRYIRQSEGSIQLTALKLSDDDSPTPQMTLAQITFQPILAGQTTISFDHTPSATDGSTIISARSSENILDMTRGLTVTIE